MKRAPTEADAWGGEPGGGWMAEGCDPTLGGDNMTLLEQAAAYDTAES